MIKVIIIDRSLKFRKMLSEKLFLFNGIQIIAEANSSRLGMELIRETTPDIVFLDADLPERRSFRMLKKLTDIKFETIFMSETSEHAMEAIKNNALDYLLKPIQVEMLKKAINAYKVKTNNEYLIRIQNVKQKISSSYDHPTKKILLAIPHGYKMMNVEDIMYCKSSGRYTIVRPYGEKSIVIGENLGSFESKFSTYGFVRIHNSYVINIHYLDTYNRDAQKNGEVHLIDGTKLKVSRTKRSEFLRVLKGYKLMAG